MRRAMRKPRELQFKYFSARLTELNNYLPFFPGSSSNKKIPPQELNKILLHAVPKSWAKQAYLQGWDFEMKSYKATCKLFEIIEVAEQIYEGVNTSKNPPSEDANRASHGRKRKGGGPPRLPTPRRAALASARQEIQTIQAIGRPEGKHACCMVPDTLRKILKYSRITLPSTPRSRHTKKNPALAAKKKW